MGRWLEMKLLIDPWSAWWGVIIASILFTVFGAVYQLKRWDD